MTKVDYGSFADFIAHPRSANIPEKENKENSDLGPKTTSVLHLLLVAPYLL